MSVRTLLAPRTQQETIKGDEMSAEALDLVKPERFLPTKKRSAINYCWYLSLSRRLPQVVPARFLPNGDRHPQVDSTLSQVSSQCGGSVSKSVAKCIGFSNLWPEGAFFNPLARQRSP